MEWAHQAAEEIKINVTHRRTFETSPNEPSTPSLSPGEEQGGKIRMRAIARKRNTYGRGLGDILLPEGKTVEALVEGALSQAFTESGYKMIGSKEQAPAALGYVSDRN